MIKQCGRLLLVLVVLATGLVVTAGPAMAAPCYQHSCDYLDPQATGCASGAVNKYEYTYVGYRIEHRFSATCQATWTRVTYVTGAPWSFYAYQESKLPAPSTVTIKQNVTFVSDTQGWSKMYSYSSWSRSCAVSNTGSTCGAYV